LEGVLSAGAMRYDKLDANVALVQLASMRHGWLRADESMP
jgi:hypothetical protein